MKCIKCKEKNISSANYCQKCGNKFSEEEKKQAHKKTLVGKLELAEKAYKVCTLKVITDHIIFKISSIIILIIGGLFLVFNNGNKVKILDDSQYVLEYNTKLDEYYIKTTNDKISLKLYVPNKASDLTIMHMANENKLEEKTIEKNEEIILNVNNEDEYYLLKSNVNDLKIIIYRVDNNE